MKNKNWIGQPVNCWLMEVLLLDGKDVRMSGQDVRRGTFSHRHAVLRDEKTDESYNRLSRIPDAKGKFRIYNSLLSEYGVLGFEYGYALANPNALVIMGSAVW